MRVDCKAATVKAVSEGNLNNEHTTNTPTQAIFTRETDFATLSSGAPRRRKVDCKYAPVRKTTDGQAHNDLTVLSTHCLPYGLRPVTRRRALKSAGGAVKFG
jgi:hypothetical protein